MTSWVSMLLLFESQCCCKSELNRIAVAPDGGFFFFFWGAVARTCLTFAFALFSSVLSRLTCSTNGWCVWFRVCVSALFLCALVEWSISSVHVVDLLSPNAHITQPTPNRWPCCLLSHSSLMGKRWMSPHLCLPECLVCPDSYLHCRYYNLWMSHVDSKPQWLTCFSLPDPGFIFFPGLRFS